MWYIFSRRIKRLNVTWNGTSSHSLKFSLWGRLDHELCSPSLSDAFVLVCNSHKMSPLRCKSAQMEAFQWRTYKRIVSAPLESSSRETSAACDWAEAEGRLQAAHTWGCWVKMAQSLAAGATGPPILSGGRRRAAGGETALSSEDEP